MPMQKWRRRSTRIGTADAGAGEGPWRVDLTSPGVTERELLSEKPLRGEDEQRQASSVENGPPLSCWCSNGSWTIPNSQVSEVNKESPPIPPAKMSMLIALAALL